MYRDELISQKQAEQFWLKKLKRINQPPLFRATDPGKPGVLEYHRQVPGEIAAKLNSLFNGTNRNANRFLLYLSVLKVLYYKYSGCADIVVGTSDMEFPGVCTTAGRLIFLRTELEREATCKDLVKQEQRSLLEAVRHQDYDSQAFLSRYRVNWPDEEASLFRLGFFYNRLNTIEIPANCFEILVAVNEATRENLPPTLDFRYPAGIHPFLIELFANNYIAALNDLLNHSQVQLKDIRILSARERELLENFAAPESRPHPVKTVICRFDEQARKTPDRTAVVNGTQQITYKELAEKSRQWADLLREKECTPGSIVGIMLDRSLEMVIGILAILKTGSAYLPIAPAYPEERIAFMLEDSGARLLLTIRALAGKMEKITSWEGEILFLEELPARSPAAACLPHYSLRPGDLAYIIYTSGSTGLPRGVAVEHKSLLNILLALQEKYPLREHDTYLLKTTYSFDVSAAELFGWFFQGGRLALLEKDNEMDPARILAAIATFGITHINFVPSMFLGFVDCLNSENIHQLSSLRYIFLAGEALLPGVVEKFRRLPAGTHLENIYGPTEATIYATGYSLSAWKGGEVPIGKPLANVRLDILDRFADPQPVGVPGELCISGIGTARGYLNNPELTALRFCLRRPGGRFLKKLPPWTPRKNFLLDHSPIYKTGDLGRWLAEGNIEFLGRIDYQVKVRGFRIELGEIENRLLMHEAVEQAVVVARDDHEGGKYLAAYLITGNEADIPGIRRHLENYLPHYMIPAYFIPLETLPLNSSGKVDKNALPAPQLKTGANYVAPQTRWERRLAEIWAEVLKLDQQVIGIDDNFFYLGGHSLRASVMISRVHKELEVKLPLGTVFKTPRIRPLARYIEENTGTRCESIPPVEEKEYYNVSFVQKRMYFVQQINPDNRGYNLPVNAILQGHVSKTHLEKVFETLMERHESFRTSFHLPDGELVQKISKNPGFAIEYYETEESSAGVENTVRHLGRPYDLSQAPLWRVGLITFTNNRFLLAMNFHHIMFDGVSLGLLVNEFMTLYAEGELPRPGLQYKDFAQWQHSKPQLKLIRQQEEYWLKEFTGELSLLDLPADFPRPPMLNFTGSHIRVLLDADKTKALKQIAASEGATLFMALLAAVNVFLYKMCGQEDIVVGTSAAGRRHENLHHIIGMFVNALALRNHPNSEKTFSQLLREIKTRTLAAFDNQDYPFEDLVEHLLAERQPGRNPLFDVMFVLNNEEVEEASIPGLKLLPYKHEKGTTQLDLKIRAREIADEIAISFEYSTQLFKKETMEMYMENLIQVLDAIIENKDIQLQEISPDCDLLTADTEVFAAEQGDFGF